MKSIKKWLKNHCQILKFVTTTFVVWQVVLMLIIFLGSKYFPINQDSQYLYGEKETLVSPQWLWSRANFDGRYYLSIAQKGYVFNQQSFFPLYPKIIAWLTPLFNGQNLMAGWVANLVFLYWALFFFYKLMRLDFTEKVTKRAIFYLLLFPTAFYFSMVYTEALFFLLIILSFYLAKTGRWWPAGLVVALASAIRLPGIFLLPAIGVEWWVQYQSVKNKAQKQALIRNLGAFFIMPLGLLFYMRFLALVFNDPLMFVHTQSFFGPGRSGERIILLYQVIWRYLKMLFTAEKNSSLYLTVSLEFLSAMSFFVLMIFTYLRRWYAYFVFMFLVLVAPTLTGTFSSLPRYVLVLFPAFIILSLWSEKYRWLRVIYPLVSIPLFVICLWLFTRGYFAA